MNGERRARGVTRRIAIIPALDEEPVLGATLDAIPPGLFDLVVVADNGSRDRTAEVARAHGACAVTIGERGYGAACLAAISWLGETDAVLVFLQADGSEKAAEAASLMRPVLAGEADLVIGSRVLGDAEPGSLLPHQRFGNWLATTLIRILYRHRYTDLGPFRAIRLDTLRRLRMQERTYGWTVEMQVRALQAGLRVIELPVSYGRRQAGVNKVSGNLKASLQAGWMIIGTVLYLKGLGLFFKGRE